MNWFTRFFPHKSEVVTEESLDRISEAQRVEEENNRNRMTVALECLKTGRVTIGEVDEDGKLTITHPD